MSEVYYIRAKKESQDIANRLKELSLLQNGWLNGEGVAPKKENLDWLLGAFENYYDSTLPIPYLYPTVDGGIQAEWTNEHYDVSLNIDLKTKKAFYQELNHDTDATEETTLLLNRGEDWQLLNNKLQSINR
jgi:hypothetical protein